VTYVLIILGAALAAAAAVLGLRLLRDRLRAQAERRASGIVSDAESRAQTRLKEAELEAEESEADEPPAEEAPAEEPAAEEETPAEEESG